MWDHVIPSFARVRLEPGYVKGSKQLGHGTQEDSVGGRSLLKGLYISCKVTGERFRESLTADKQCASCVEGTSTTTF